MASSIHEIRLATLAEAAAIARMSRDCIEQGLGWSWTETRVERSIRDRSSNVIVARTGGSLLGFGIMRYGMQTAHLLLLAVQPGRRRRGLGTALLRWLEAPAQVAGIERIQVETRADSAGARPFYLQLGYREIARIPGYYQGMEDGLRLEKLLLTPVAEPGTQ
jgi:[ribosomal protein S18]-alanine N-acetyltransferase